MDGRSIPANMTSVVLPDLHFPRFRVKQKDVATPPHWVRGTTSLRGSFILEELRSHRKVKWTGEKGREEGREKKGEEGIEKRREKGRDQGKKEGKRSDEEEERNKRFRRKEG